MDPNTVTAQEEAIIDYDLECALCSDILFKPVSLDCGHTYCKGCLINALKIKPKCPLCRTPCFLQESSMEENVVLKSIVGKKYPDFIKNKEEQDKSGEQEQERDDSDDIYEPVRQDFNSTVILPLTEPLNKVIYPDSEGQVKVRIKFNPQLMQNVCSNGKFVAIPGSVIQDKTKYKTCILAFKDIRPVENAKNTYIIKFKAYERVVVNRYSDLEVAPEEGQVWGHGHEGGALTVKSANGYFLNDFNIATVEQVGEQVTYIEALLNQKAAIWREVSTSTFNHLTPKIQLLLLQPDQDRDMSYFEKFSLGLARMLKMSDSEKVKMFEMENTLERLIILRKWLDRLKDCDEMEKFFEIEIPGHMIFSSLKMSLLVLLGVILLMYLSWNGYLGKNFNNVKIGKSMPKSYI